MDGFPDGRCSWLTALGKNDNRPRVKRFHQQGCEDDTVLILLVYGIQNQALRPEQATPS